MFPSVHRWSLESNVCFVPFWCFRMVYEFPFCFSRWTVNNQHEKNMVLRFYSHKITWNRYFPMVFPWFSYGFVNVSPGVSWPFLARLGCWYFGRSQRASLLGLGRGSRICQEVYGGFPKRGYPIAGWCTVENTMIWWYRGTPISGNLHISIYIYLSIFRSVHVCIYVILYV